MPIIEDEASFALSLLLRDGWKELARVRIEPLVSGLSDATVFLVAEDGRPLRYLKIARDNAAAALREEITRTGWLAERGVRVPAILRFDDRSDQIVMLTDAVPGFPAEASPLPAPRLINALAKGLAALHALSPADCPFDESLAVRLSRAARAIAAGEVDTEAFAPRNRGIAPRALLARLAAEQPAEDIVVVHGDATLTNFIVDGDGAIGFVDCGNVGRGDRYLDLAILSADIQEHHGAEAAARFAQTYSQCAWDSTKARFFSDLYEFF